MFFNQKGWAMPLVLMLVFVMTLLSTALWQYSMRDLKDVSMEEKKLQAHYLARSGAELVLEYINDDTDTRFESLKNMKSELQSFNENNNNYFTVEVYEDEERMLIRSTGEVDGIEETLILEIQNEFWSK